MDKIKSRSKKIRKGDLVVAIAGNAKGQKGIVQSLNGDRVIVEGLNMRKKHMKKSEDAPKGRIIQIAGSMDISNLKVWDQDVAAKLKVQTNEQGERHFVYKKGDKEIIYRSVKKPK